MARCAWNRRPKRSCTVAFPLSARLPRELARQLARRTGIVPSGLSVLRADRRDLQHHRQHSSPGSTEITPPEHIVVLGAGPAGLAVAHQLSANGVRVTVLERN